MFVSTQVLSTWPLKNCSTASQYWQVRRCFIESMQGSWQCFSVFMTELSLINYGLCCWWHVAESLCVHIKISRRIGWQGFFDQHMLNLLISAYQHQKKMKLLQRSPLSRLGLYSRLVLITLSVCQAGVTHLLGILYKRMNLKTTPVIILYSYCILQMSM